MTSGYWAFALASIFGFVAGAAWMLFKFVRWALFDPEFLDKLIARLRAMRDEA